MVVTMKGFDANDKGRWVNDCSGMEADGDTIEEWSWDNDPLSFYWPPVVGNRELVFWLGKNGQPPLGMDRCLCLERFWVVFPNLAQLRPPFTAGVKHQNIFINIRVKWNAPADIFFYKSGVHSRSTYNIRSSISICPINQKRIYRLFVPFSWNTDASSL